MWSKVKSDWNPHKRTILVKRHWICNRFRTLKAPWEWWWRVGLDKKPPDPELWGSSLGPGWSPETAGRCPDRPTPHVMYCGLGLHHVGPSLQGGHVQFWPIVGPGGGHVGNTGWVVFFEHSRFSLVHDKKKKKCSKCKIFIVSVHVMKLNKVWRLFVVQLK